MGKQSGNGERFMDTRAQCYDTTRSYTKPLPRTRRTLEAEGLCLFTGVYDTIIFMCSRKENRQAFYLCLNSCIYKSTLKIRTLQTKIENRFVKCFSEYMQFCETKEETIARRVHCSVCHFPRTNEHRCAFMATND